MALYGSCAQQPPRVTGFFSDMRYIEGPGDVLGTEVWIVYARGKFWATVQMAEGAPEPPVVVPVEVSGSTIKFSIRESLVNQSGNPFDLVISFEGTVTRAGLSGKANSVPFNLKRSASYWQ
jgi:hypothetical protein